MIVIDENYAIETDSFGNYSLFRRKVKKTGKNVGEETKDYVGHYSTLKGAIERYRVDRFNSETEDKVVSLADAVKLLREIENDAISKLGL